MIDNDPVWLFDGDCMLCSRAVAFTLRHEKHDKIRFVALQSKLGHQLAKTHGIDPTEPDSFLFLENNRAYFKSEGVIALSRHLRFPGNLFSLFHIFPKPLRDRLYDIIAQNRYRWFGRTEFCAAPGHGNRRRFVLPDDMDE
ncbi:MAG: DCC1-like thiol-disulfide oxidoreductase family protein [Pseudomonadota bacterium]